MSETGSIGQSAPAPSAPAPAAPSGGPPPAESVTQHKSAMTDRKAAATAVLERARSAPKGEPAKAAPAPAAAPPAPAPATPTAAEAKALDEAQVQKIARATVQAEREAYEAKQRLKEYEAKVKSYEEAEAKRKGLTPLQLLEAEGTTLDQVHDRIVKGEFKPKTAVELELEKTAGTAKSAEARIEALEKQLKEEREQAKARDEHAYLASEIKSKAEDFPLLDAFDWAPSRVREVYYEEEKRLAPTGEKPDLTQVMKSVQDGVEADIRKVFAHDGALKRFLVANKDRVAALLGSSAPASPTETTPPASLGTQPQSSSSRRNDPAALTRAAAQDAGTRRVGGTLSTPSERKANATAALLRARSAKT